MTDVFDATILCKTCKQQMSPRVINKNGAHLRAVECQKCGDKIIHPSDLNALERFKDIKGKTYNVKLRIVGNSHAISIPKEMVNFMKQQKKTFDELDQIVRLAFEDMHRISLRFGNGEEEY